MKSLFGSRRSIPVRLGGLFLLSLSAIGCTPQGERQEGDGAVPGGTNQQSVVNQVGGGTSPDEMPGVGAPGSGGNGTQ